MTKTLFLCLLAISLGCFVSAANADVTTDAGNWLIAQQDDSGGATDGAFPWTVGGGLFANTQGATSLGLIRAFQLTGDNTMLDGAVANGDFILGGYGGLPNSSYTDGDPRFATHDPMFLEVLATESGNTAYSDYLQTNFWDKLGSTSYGENNNLDADGFANAILNSRDGQGIIELSPWDLSKTAIAAHLAGENAIRDAFMDVILDGLNMTTLADSTFDLHGLAGSIWASAVTGIDLDPTAGRWASSNSTTDLATELLGFQAVNGGFVFNSTADTNDGNNANTQVSAFAILALNDLDGSGFSSEIENALDFLRDVQDGSGQFLVSLGAPSDSAGGVEVHGEALEAFASAVPEPATGVIVVGLVGLILARRRRI